MADMNRWHRQLKRRTLQELRDEVSVLRTAAKNGQEGGQYMAGLVVALIDAKLEALDEADDREGCFSADDIDEWLKS